MWFAVFDWEHEKQEFLTNPKLYRVGLDDVFFSANVFWRWFSYAVFQGILLAVAVFVTMDSATETHG